MEVLRQILVKFLYTVYIPLETPCIMYHCNIASED